MKSFVVLTASGTDRVGIVDDLSAALLDAGCSIEESRMAVLGGEFAFIVLASGEPASVEGLIAGAADLGSRIGVEISARPTGAHRAVPSGRPYLIESVSLDTPGIVHAVAALLRRRGVNIDSLETDTTGAPFTGAPMFRMRVIAIVPPQLHVGDLRRELEEVAAAGDLDITVRPLIAPAEQ